MARRIASRLRDPIIFPFILQSVSLVCYVFYVCTYLLLYYIVYTRDLDVASAHASALYMDIPYEHFVN